jgi:hypothetical protein
MKKEVRRIYLEMMAEITSTAKLSLPEIVGIEKNFLDCFLAWERVKMLGKKFDTDQEEIDFFRNIKPSFTSVIEYYNVLNEALLYAPANATLNWAYWNKELGRYKRFCDRHKAFIDYYESGSWRNDPEYFLTRNFLPPKEGPIKIYDADIAWCTNGDHLVASLHTLNLYKIYVAGLLRKLSQHITSGTNPEINS